MRVTLLRRFKDVSIRWKLMILVVLSTSTALLIATGSFAIYDIRSLRQKTEADLEAVADQVIINVAPALDFGDPKSAQDILDALRARPPIVLAAVLDARGKVFAQYTPAKSTSSISPDERSREGSYFEGGLLHLLRPIFNKSGERTGSLYLESDMRELDETLSATLRIMGLAFAASLPRRSFWRAASSPSSRDPSCTLSGSRPGFPRRGTTASGR